MRPWKTRFFVIVIANVLSQNTIESSLLLTCKSYKILLSQTASHAALVAATYSAFADDNVTVAYFLEHHEIILDLS